MLLVGGVLLMIWIYFFDFGSLVPTHQPAPLLLLFSGDQCLSLFLQGWQRWKLFPEHCSHGFRCALLLELRIVIKELTSLLLSDLVAPLQSELFMGNLIGVSCANLPDPDSHFNGEPLQADAKSGNSLGGIFQGQLHLGQVELLCPVAHWDSWKEFLQFWLGQEPAFWVDGSSAFASCLHLGWWKELVFENSCFPLQSARIGPLCFQSLLVFGGRSSVDYCANVIMCLVTKPFNQGFKTQSAAISEWCAVGIERTPELALLAHFLMRPTWCHRWCIIYYLRLRLLEYNNSFYGRTAGNIIYYINAILMSIM